MSDKQGGSTPQEYEETVSPENPPQASGAPAAAVPAIFYFLAPIALLIGVLVLALFYWGNGDDSQDDFVEPTTGISDEATPGGGNPAPRPEGTRDETEFRGVDRQP